MQGINYKYVSIILGLLVVLFAALYFSKPDPSVGDVYQSASDHVKACSDKIAAWNQKYATVASSSDKSSDFANIVKDCQEELKGSHQDLSE